MLLKQKIIIKYSGQAEPIILKRQLKENRVEVDRYITLRHGQHQAVACSARL
jgi:hypothetical protein